MTDNPNHKDACPWRLIGLGPHRRSALVHYVCAIGPQRQKLLVSAAEVR